MHSRIEILPFTFMCYLICDLLRLKMKALDIDQESRDTYKTAYIPCSLLLLLRVLSTVSRDAII